MVDKIYYEGSNYKLWWDDVEKIGRAYVNGAVDELAAKDFAKCVTEMADDRRKPVDWLHMVSTATPPPSKARKILADAMSGSAAGKSAFVGASIVIRTTVNFMQGISGKRMRSRHFATEKEALKWLRKDCS